MIKAIKPAFAFFGTSDFAVFVLDELEKAKLLPELIVTLPPQPQGRKLVLTPTAVSNWAKTRKINTLESLSAKGSEFEEKLKLFSPKLGWDFFVVASYGNILPKNILDMPKLKTLNVHPSLLPLLRGPAPIERSVLANMQDTGVTIMRLDELTDHGPIISQKKIHVNPWPMDRIQLEIILGREGGILLSETIPKWIYGEIKEIEQKHEEATFTTKVTKDEAKLDLKDAPLTNLLKVKAFYRWPKAYIVDKDKNGKEKRLVIVDAEIKNGQFLITRVIPEGGKEMSWADYNLGK